METKCLSIGGASDLHLVMNILLFQKLIKLALNRLIIMVGSKY
jgi:hypothetical protein